MHRPIPDTPLYVRLRQGHKNRLGHDLTGYMTTDAQGISHLTRTCECQSSDTVPAGRHQAQGAGDWHNDPRHNHVDEPLTRQEASKALQAHLNGLAF